ncbi:MAG: sensor histidine kinase KdpD, partial [Anaerolineaceae bacterium]|nr:sensor histidine kinase KdpD [Anaerolineaceae bacterium]
MYPDQKYPDLERLSDRSRVEAKTRRRGRLKIFLGYAAGVGKTFAMLEAAHRQKEEGVEVLIGWVETHALEETGALLKGLAVWPGRRIETRGKVLFELDVEGILARRPQLVLVDDLAHTNLPGGRHLKRFQDIEELLAAGIDVYTTIDVQYWESLNDIVFQITGVRVLETVPDRVFDRADEIELVDLPTEELIRRLAEGRIKHHNQAAGVKDALFRQGNLTALRELAMRQAAEHTDHQMRASMQSQATPGPWLAGERILVSLSSHPVGERLVRAGRKLADELKAEWFVLFVETADHLGMPPQNRIRINDNLALAERLGAHVVKASANSVAEEVLRFCQQHNITKIIAGRPRRPRWLEFLKPSVIEEIFQKSGRIDVFVVNESQDKPESKGLESWLPHRPLLHYLGSLGLVGAATIISIFIRSGINPVNLVMIYLAAVVLTAVFLGRGPSMLASLVSVAVFDFFIVNPRFSLAVDDTQYLITFAGLLIVGLVISNSATLLRNQVEALQLREMHAQVLNRFGQQLTSAVTLDQVLEITLQN